jgi:hypothetical protein
MLWEIHDRQMQYGFLSFFLCSTVHFIIQDDEIKSATSQNIGEQIAIDFTGLSQSRTSEE